MRTSSSSLETPKEELKLKHGAKYWGAERENSTYIVLIPAACVVILSSNVNVAFRSQFYQNIIYFTRGWFCGMCFIKLAKKSDRFIHYFIKMQ